MQCLQRFYFYFILYYCSIIIILFIFLFLFYFFISFIYFLFGVCVDIIDLERLSNYSQTHNVAFWALYSDSSA